MINLKIKFTKPNSEFFSSYQLLSIIGMFLNRINYKQFNIIIQHKRHMKRKKPNSFDTKMF